MVDSSARGRWTSSWVAVVTSAAFALAQWPVFARTGAQVPGAGASTRPCRIHGVVQSADATLPGVAVTAREGDVVRAVTSTDVDGSYVLNVAPGTYQIRIEFSVFTSSDRSVTVSLPACDASVDASLVLASRVPGATLPPVAPVAAPAANGPAAGAPGGRGGRGGRLGGPARFQALAVEQSAAGAAAVETVLAVMGAGPDDDPAARLLPPGFSSGAVGDAVTVSGSMVQLDRNLLNDRQDALGRGEFGLADGQAFGAPVQAGLGGQVGGAEIGGGGGRGGGGPGGIGGRGGRGGATGLQVNATYGLGGSMFDSAPYALRGEAAPEA